MTAPKKLVAVPQFEPTTNTSQDVFPRDECLNWMRDWVDPKHQKNQVIAFSLSHIDARAVGDAFDDITHVMIQVDPKTGALPSNLSMTLETAVDEFWRAAKAHTAALYTNRQGYTIKGHRRGGQIKLDDGTFEEEDPLTVPPRTLFPFSVTPPPGVRENFEGNEKPNAEGALGAMQRTLDTKMRVDQATVDKMMKGYEQWNEHLMNKVTELVEINVQHYRQLQEAEDRKATRVAEANKAAFELETRAMIVDNINKYVVPTVALVLKAKLGLVDAVPALGEGGEAQPNAASLIATVRALKLKPKQLGAFVADLDKDQQDMLQPLVLELSAGMTKAEQHELVAVIEAKTAEKSAAQGDAK